MKKNLCALITAAGLMLAGTCHAGVVGFDDVDTAGDFASLGDISPYAGLTWSADWYAGDTGIDGYANGARSGTRYAVNGFGADDVSVGSATGFNFAGAWFAAAMGAADKAGWINISAYDAANQLIGSTGNVAIGDHYQWVGAGFNNVSRLSITRDSGWYVMDDFTTTAGVAAPVPEPGTTLMLGVGLLTVLGRAMSRRRSARAAGKSST
ncbi:PEP-CTERM sorting domain-containing protein [Oxalobacteraceae bacterium OTU3REALA1]|nr:PEP-CTERM sorting domain-containing protein [Oxalobacteraceae bacterium OTU3REALA1]